jgi:hypothetical protein
MKTSFWNNTQLANIQGSAQILDSHNSFMVIDTPVSKGLAMTGTAKEESC